MTVSRILVAHDLETTSDRALECARALARTYGAELILLYVMENQFMHAVVADPRDVVAGMRHQLHSRLTADDLRLTRARVAVEESDQPAGAILDFARNNGVDLIVMGTHGRKAIGRLLMGSVAQRVVRSAPCPVLTVRHFDPATPR